MLGICQVSKKENNRLIYHRSLRKGETKKKMKKKSYLINIKRMNYNKYIPKAYNIILIYNNEVLKKRFSYNDFKFES